MPSETAALPRPRVIELSYWLWLGACLVGVITAAATLPYFGELQAAVLLMVEQQFPHETPATREEVATVTVTTLMGAGVAIILVQLAFAITMHSGRGWARFVLVLLTLLGMLYNVAVFATAPTVSQVGLLTSTVLMVIAVVLMLRPDARTWFAQRRLAQSVGYGYSE
ncbi:MAG: hypothetical protein M3460_09110 [Actinomycetota bacterium]|nr:hypothetical protein [Actinomycetota bacterium]